ncbi:uncharacterized protein N7525_011355 [Penicillium rubens]|uniref:uncharacterized protein n=1 Tax=Penicillium rubens TaxID=1108849 RepID=UPI002A5AD1BF|nr:uncharacterized protein N7525_011355 [Penicillium rubens]KAJ5822071.1 hypothetical protein N7525_011355 [Penicillium rubens]
MVWAERRKRKQSDCTVFGCLTDGEEYTFYHLSHDGLWSKEGIVSLAKESNNYRSSLNKTAAIDPKLGKSSLRCVNATQSQQNLEDVVKAASMSMVSLLVKGLHKTQPELHHLKKQGRL